MMAQWGFVTGYECGIPTGYEWNIRFHTLHMNKQWQARKTSC